MRTPRGLRAACAGLMLPLLSLATPARAEGTTVGGEQLAGHGTVVAEEAPPLPHDVSAAGWLVADLDTGDVLAAKDPHGHFAPASTLKALTALTLIPRLDPNHQVVPSFDDLNVDGSKVGLVEHVAYPISQLFTAMMVVSGNDAANTLADAGGGIGRTVQDMNDVAAKLQAQDTHAMTPNGLDAPGQRSSPYDLALIARAAMQLPDFRHYVATKHSQIRGPHGRSIPISSHDKLLYNYDGAIGIKNGYTVKAMATFIGAATRGGHTLVVTLMRANPRYWPEAAALLDWGFKAEQFGVAPVGHLVDPEGTPAKTAGQPATVRAIAARTPSAPAKGLPVLPIGLLAAGLTTAAVIRRRFT